MAEQPRTVVRRAALPARRAAVLLLGATAYAAVAVAGEPFTWHVRLATAVPAVVFAVLAVATGWHRSGPLVGIATRLDALHFSATTMTTVGYGDIADHSASWHAGS